MDESVPAARSDSPGWPAVLTVTLLVLLAVLVAWILLVSTGHGTIHLVTVGIAIVVALAIPAWAIWGLDGD